LDGGVCAPTEMGTGGFPKGGADLEWNIMESHSFGSCVRVGCLTHGATELAVDISVAVVLIEVESLRIASRLLPEFNTMG
jgi:hypothetical protein